MKEDRSEILSRFLQLQERLSKYNCPSRGQRRQEVSNVNLRYGRL